MKLLITIFAILGIMSACTTEASTPNNFSLVESTGIYYVVKDSRTNCEYLAQSNAAFVLVVDSCKKHE
jgi:hypothetical protein